MPTTLSTLKKVKSSLQKKTVKDLIISHKEDNGEFTALIKAENCKDLSKKISQKLPDLDTIMVYQERKEELEDEEFII